MPFVGSLVLIGVVVYAVTRWSLGLHGTPAKHSAPKSEPENPTGPEDRRPAEGQPSTAVASYRPGLARDLEQWVAAGLLSPEQSAAILSHEEARAEAAARVPPPPPAPPPPARPSRVGLVAEALGYLGGILAIVGLVLLVSRYWPDMATAGQLALSGGAALVLLGAGALVHEQTNPALARLRWFQWLVSTASTAVFTYVLVIDGFDVDRLETVVLACGAAVAIQSGLLWWWRARPVQQLTALGGVAVFAGALVTQFAADSAAGLAVWIVGGLFIALGLRRLTPLPLLTEGVGCVTVIVGAELTAIDWTGFSLAFSVATAFGLLALAAIPGLAPARSDQLLTAILGALALLQNAPAALGYFGENAAVVTGLTTWVIGAALMVIAARRFVRLPVIAEILGGIALLGGAALSGVEWQGFATIFGLATAAALVALGMLPGRVLLSVFGSLGLLINIPWAISWFFPGEGRVPLLILVSGALIIAIAVLMTRMGGRFRRELGSSRERQPPAPEAAPGDDTGSDRPIGGRNVTD